MGLSESRGPQIKQIDPRVTETARKLDYLSENFGANMAQEISAGAAGIGRFAGEFTPLGQGKDAAAMSQPGDIIIARGLFPDSDPRIDVVGFDPSLNLESVVESYEDQGLVELYRPSQNFAENPALLAKAAALMGGAKSGVGLVNDVLKGLNSAADLKLKYKKLDDIRVTDRQPKFLSPVVQLMSKGYRSDNEKTSVYRFSVIGKRKGTFYDSADYRPEFEVTVIHDCINIIDARILSLKSEDKGTTLPYEMNVTITEGEHSPHRLPGFIRMNIEVDWNPDRASDLLWGGSNESYRASATLEVRSDGSVKIEPGTKSPEVKITPARAVRPSAPGCSALYAQMRNKSRTPNNPQPTPLPTLGAGSGGTGSRPRRPVIAGPSTALRPNPQNGRNIFFGFRSANPEAYALQEVKMWWDSLPHAVKAAVISGQRALYVTGHADYTGRDSFNLSLSKRRASAIAQLIQRVAGHQLKMRIQGMGWRSARDAGQRPGHRNQNWRRVTISLDNPG